MTELNLRENYLHAAGWPIDNTSLEEMVYRVITIVGSSEFLYNNFLNDNYLFARMKEMEMAKLSELLIAIAIICRSLLDSSIDIPNVIEEGENNVGVITINKINQPLTFHESCNKIIHAREVYFDVEESASIESGFLNHFIYLYGDRDGVNWKAAVDLIKFCKYAGSVM